jgi:hypothetical protein
MKTRINTSNLKKMVVTIAAAMVLATGTFAIPANNEEMIPASKLAALMNATEQSIRFVAPAVEESQDVFYAMQELNTLAESVEASVKYVAPSAEEEIVAPEMENLNALAETIEASIKYVAPAVEETPEVASAMEELDKIAASTEAAVAFRAPVADDTTESVTSEDQDTNSILADQTK